MRCTSILNPLGDELTDDEAITIGADYIVLAVYAALGRDVLLRVLSVKPELRWPSSGLPPMWRSRMFEVLSSKIPSNWCAEVTSDGALRLEPEKWLRPGFWEDLVDWSPLSKSAQEDYDAELAVILREASSA